MAQVYSDIQVHLQRVRWAWKRAAALQGLSAVTMETLGMLLVFAVVDSVYATPQVMRVIILGGIAVTAAILLIRQVLRPLTRVIPDEQIALYIEERQHEIDGALLSATAFGKGGRSGSSDIYNYIIDNIVASAAGKAGAVRLSRVLDLRKLRKYMIAALCVLLFFGFTAFRFSNVFSGRAQRVLMPWESSDEDLRSVALPAEKLMHCELLVTPVDRRVPRGGSASIKARLSSQVPADPVLKFHTAGSPEFKELRMNAIEELNTFTQELQDVNDGIEFFVQFGPSPRQISEIATLSVYDPLVVKNYEVTTLSPEYTRLEATVASAPRGDVTALAGSKVLIRTVTNTALKSGELVFEDGRKIALERDEDPCVMKGEFIIESDAAYVVKIDSVDEQSVRSDRFIVKSLTDEAPKAAVTSPSADLEVHPSAEIEFTAKVSDDVGIKSVEIVYSVGTESTASTRLPFKFKPGPGEQEAALTLEVSDLCKQSHAGDTLFYFVSASDMKGQETKTDMFMIRLRPYEVAGAYPSGPGHAPPDTAAPSLMQFIAAAWHIDQERPNFEAAELQRQCVKLADCMRLPPFKYARVTPDHLTPAERKIFDQATASVNAGIQDLRQAEPAQAAKDLQRGLALFEKISFHLDILHKGEGAEALSNAEQDQVASTLGFAEKMGPPPPPEPLRVFDTKWNPEHRRQIKNGDAQQLLEQAEKLRQRQEQIVDEAARQEATRMAPRRGEDGAPQQPARQAQENPLQLPAGNQNQNGASQERRDNLQRAQDQLRQEMNAFATKLAAATGDDRTSQEALNHARDAAKAMEDALQQMRNGNMQQAAARGERAGAELNRTAQQLRAAALDSLDPAVAAVEELGHEIAAVQRQIEEQTAKLVESSRARSQIGAGKDVRLTPQEQQKLAGLSRLQAENRARAENLEHYVEVLANAAESAGKKDAAEALKRAAKAIRQEGLVSTMVTAAVSLAQQETGDAADAHARLDKTLEKVNGALRKATDALAGTTEDKVKRALNDARGILSDAERLTGNAPEQWQAANAQSHSASDRTASGNQDRASAKARSNGNAALTEDARRQMRTEMYHDSVRMVRRLEQDKIGDPDQARALRGAIENERDFEKMLEEGGSTQLTQYLRNVSEISEKLEDKLQNILKARRLAAGRREETPPQYREMVNRYYEMLAKE